MNCFQICIFALCNTTLYVLWLVLFKLWIAFKFVSLHYATQLHLFFSSQIESCELLSNLYLCTMQHNLQMSISLFTIVVNCFQICIFALCNTTFLFLKSRTISCELLSNLYLCTMQHNSKRNKRIDNTVVNCFQICIFALCNTTITSISRYQWLLWIAFKFVSLHYATQHSFLHTISLLVVNCFQICIFALCNTTMTRFFQRYSVLWIAFKFVSLHYATQHSSFRI